MRLILLMICCWATSAAQEQAVIYFGSKPVSIERVLREAEAKFDIRYSYLDSLLTGKVVNFQPRNYTLPQLHTEIELQCRLKVLQLDSRYYSLVPVEDDSVAEQLPEIRIHGYLSRGIIKRNQSFLISQGKIEELPGVTDADILFSLQQLPGVKSPNETASGLHVRGGTPDQNLILWDGIRVYHPGHLFGMVSPLNPYVDQRISFTNKAASPKYGERISAVIDIHSADSIPKKIGIDAGINGLNADAYIKIPIVKNKLGAQFSVRRSFTDVVQTPAFNSLSRKVFQHTNFADFGNDNLFVFKDISGKLTYSVGKAVISATALFIDNDLRFETLDEGESQRRQNMEIRNIGYSINWKYNYSDSFRQNFTLYYSAYKFDYGDVKFNQGEEQTFGKRNKITDSGCELNFEKQYSEKIMVSFGYQLIGNDLSHVFTSGSRNLQIELDRKQAYNVTHAGYAQLKYKVGYWESEAGLRYNVFSKLRPNSIEPRFMVSRKLGRFLIQSSFERKSQVMSQVREGVANDLSLENYVWILADGQQQPLQTGNQYTVGGTFNRFSWTVDLDIYYKNVDGLTSQAFGYIDPAEQAVRRGDGFTKGIDFMIQKSSQTWRAWVTYSYQDSQNRFPGLNSGGYFPLSSDITHSLTFSVFKKWDRFSAAIGWLVRSGKPYGSLNESGEVQNAFAGRLPEYHRLDISAGYSFKWSRTVAGKAGISILNAYNRTSVISREIQRQYGSVDDYITPRYDLVNYYSLGITPNFYVRFSI